MSQSITNISLVAAFSAGLLSFVSPCVLTRNGIPARRTWHDTLLVEPNETADLALVTDNPGDWMLHCHVTDHQESGMMAVIRVS
jgi:FtsP/CotA-like multicopper oxidase with cupredoxin domain